MEVCSNMCAAAGSAACNYIGTPTSIAAPCGICPEGTTPNFTASVGSVSYGGTCIAQPAVATTLCVKFESPATATTFYKDLYVAAVCKTGDKNFGPANQPVGPRRLCGTPTK